MTVPIAITAGDPAGVGPELTARLLAELRADEAPIVIISSRDELRCGIERSGSGLALEDLLATPSYTLIEPAAEFPRVTAEVSAEAGRRALAGLETGLELHARGEIGGLLFGPLNKAALHRAGMTEPDEMRWFENRFPGRRTVSEININDAFWTSRVTSHVALREVADLVTAEGVADATELLHRLLTAAGRPHPRLAVCALNPHAGENGLFGDEEAKTIGPGVEAARSQGVDVHGPFPCDTLFRRGFDRTFDGIVTMYHDQGQIAMKTHAFDGGVTLEAGLHMPICTPAHGTAFDIVGTGSASLTSTRNAYRLLRSLVDSGV